MNPYREPAFPITDEPKVRTRRRWWSRLLCRFRFHAYSFVPCAGVVQAWVHGGPNLPVRGPWKAPFCRRAWLLACACGELVLEVEDSGFFRSLTPNPDWLTPVLVRPDDWYGRFTTDPDLIWTCHVYRP